MAFGFLCYLGYLYFCLEAGNQKLKIKLFMFVRIAVINGVDNVAKLKNEKREMFCLEFIKTNSAKQAAINAGYSKKTARTIGSDLLTKVDIKARTKELLKNYKKKNNLIADAEEVLEFFSKVLRGKTKYKKIIEGLEIQAYPDIKERTKVAELLAKTHGLFIDKVEHSGELTIEFSDDYGEES